MHVYVKMKIFNILIIFIFTVCRTVSITWEKLFNLKEVKLSSSAAEAPLFYLLPSAHSVWKGYEKEGSRLPHTCCALWGELRVYRILMTSIPVLCDVWELLLLVKLGWKWCLQRSEAEHRRRRRRVTENHYQQINLKNDVKKNIAWWRQFRYFLSAASLTLSPGLLLSSKRFCLSSKFKEKWGVYLIESRDWEILDHASFISKQFQIYELRFHALLK